MKEKWTPGPWEVGKLDHNGQRVVQAEIEVCTCWHHCVGSLERQMEANARLIARAPELYDALKEAVSNCPCSLRERESGHRIDCYAPRAIEVLAKARGEAEPEPESRAETCDPADDAELRAPYEIQEERCPPRE